MEPATLAAIALVLLVLLMLLGTPIAFALGVAGVLTVWLAGVPFSVVTSHLVGSTTSYMWVTVPLFILMGFLIDKSGIAQRLIALSEAAIGHTRGGLSHAAVMTNMLMAGMSGSGLADSAASGAMFIPGMKRAGYGAGYSAALIGCAATIASLIPPSVANVLIGLVGEISIIRLLLGGLVPGVLLGLGLMVAGYTVVRRGNIVATGTFSWKRLLLTAIPTIPALFIPVVILGGMVIGAFTATEGGAAGVIYAIVIGLFVYKKLTVRDLPKVMMTAMQPTMAIFFVIAVASLFTYILSTSQMATSMVNLFRQLTTDPVVLLLIVSLFLLLAGCFVDSGPLIFILVPILTPVTTAYGIDPVHFGVVFNICIQIGLLTPPVGLIAILTCKIAETDIPSWFREGYQFLIVMVVVLALTIFFPQVVLWLPNTMLGPAIP